MLARAVQPGPPEREPYQSPLPPEVGPKGSPDPIALHALQHALPTSFNIGGRQTDGPLVTIPRIKGHLALLDAFVRLKQEVLQCKDEIPQMPADGEKRWAWFVNLSVERFDQWAARLSPLDLELAEVEAMLPPIDILMVWHSYMLNPRWYAEDSERMPRVGILYSLGNLCMKLMPHFPELLRSPPSEARTDHFTDRLAIPFDPLISASWHSSSKDILCPFCSSELTVQYMQDDGTGYFQTGFKVQCPRASCGQKITKQHLRARKFAENIIQHQGGPGNSLPGIGNYTAQLTRNEKINSRIREHFLDVKSLAADKDVPKKILEDCDYSLPKMRAKAGRSPARARMMSAHLEPLVYSVELAGAVLRQGSFIDKMHEFGWTQPGYFDKPDDEIVLHHALARYHAFLDLLSTSPSSFFVPTLDIDLVWHTHQLFAKSYKNHCELYVGRFVNHDDKVDTFKLSNTFNLTCKAWKERFGIQYTYCGCPSQGDTIGKRLSRFMASATKKPTDSPTTVSPLGLPPPDTQATTEFRAATHPSEHNSVIFTPLNNGSKWDMKERFGKHQETMKARNEKAAKENKRRTPFDVNEANRRYRGFVAPHELAFLYPVPMFHPPAVPGGCVATNASVVNPAGACGNGDGQCGGGGCSAGGCGSAGCNSIGFAFEGPGASCASCSGK